MSRRVASLLAILLLLTVGLEGAAAKRPKEETPGVPDRELQKAIDKAISKGAKWLRSKQKQNGAWDGLIPRGKQTAYHELGTTSLSALALLAAGDERGDKAVDLAYRYLRARDRKLGRSGVRQTYDAGTLLMFVTHYWRGREDGKAKGRKAKDRRNPCGIPDDDAEKDPDAKTTQDWIKDVVRWLVDARYKQTATWGYPAHREDLSNTQYAFLGLRAARDCGFKIPSKVFLDGLRTTLDRQEKDGPKMKGRLPKASPGGHVYAQEGDRARGWSYLMEPYVPTGSMTTAGIAILAVCNDALTNPRRFGEYSRKMEYQVQRSAQDGFAWLALNWSIDKNPGSGDLNWHYYYLYGLERAGILGGRDLIGTHDWYIEGAKYLIGEQASDGHWSTGMLGKKDYEASDVVDTAWAVLFLARSTRPAPPLRAPPVTPGD